MHKFSNEIQMMYREKEICIGVNIYGDVNICKCMHAYVYVFLCEQVNDIYVSK